MSSVMCSEKGLGVPRCCVGLQAARRMPSISVLERYYLYVLEQETAAKSISVASGEGVSLDLTSYVEHQRNYK